MVMTRERVEVPKVSLDAELVTPGKAEAWLKRNVSNRKVRPSIVKVYADIMRHGNWQYPAGSIQFDKDGSLVDGQHRLHAIVLSGVSQHFVIVRGGGFDVQDVIDSGRTRSVGDQLFRRGEKHSVLLGSVVKAVMRYTRSPDAPYSSRGSIRTTDVVDFLVEHPDIRLSLPIGQRMSTRFGGGPKATFSALHYIFAEIDLDAADAFFEGLIEGVGLDKNSPLLLLRNYLMQAPWKEDSSHTEIWAKTVKTWNAIREGREVKVLRYSKTETYPQPI